MRAVAIVVLASAISILSGCERPVCVYSSYGDGPGCAASALKLVIGLPTTRSDVRDKQPLPIQVQVRSTVGPQEYWLETPGTVRLGVQGGELTEARAALVNDLVQQRQALNVSRDPDPLRPGELSLEVALSDLPIATLGGRPHRVFRSPRFDLNQKSDLAKGNNPHRALPVQGRVTVQLASLFAPEKPQLLTTEIVTPLVGEEPIRWLELFGRAASGRGLQYENSGNWLTLQNKLGESSTALLTILKGVVAIYDRDKDSGLNDLSIIPYFGSRQSQLSKFESLIPRQATAIAACAEESVLAIAVSGEVRFFAIDPTQSNVVRSLVTRAVPGVAAPVLAMRDISGAIPKQPSQKYIAAVADGVGKITLIPLIGTGSMATVDLNGAFTPNGTWQVRALALADLDSDGLQDLVLAAPDGRLSWLAQEPDGSFLDTALELGISVADAASLSVGDLNGDLVPDLAVATTAAAGGNVTVFWNQGS